LLSQSVSGVQNAQLAPARQPAASAMLPARAPMSTPAPQATARGDQAVYLPPTATRHLLAVDDMLRQVVVATDRLRTATIDATIDYGRGTRASAQISFDLGAKGEVPRMHMTSIYTGSTSSQKVERITIGEQSWERGPDGHWNERSAHEGIVDQVQLFLPHIDGVTNAEQLNATTLTSLRWYDSSRNADVTIVVDPATGIPRDLRQVTRSDGTILTITYNGWNMPLDISAP
jgi:hypothetical protein